MKKISFAAKAAIVTMLYSSAAMASPESDIAALRAEIAAMRQSYESRITELEGKLAAVETSKQQVAANDAAGDASPLIPASGARKVRDNTFNPSIGATFNGKFAGYSNKNAGDIAGFAVGHEGERPHKGFGVGHTELNLSANADDKFKGSTTIALADHDGDTEVELEEAYIQTLPGMGMPDGMSLKAGRALWNFGYMNEHHQHADDFADRPLPYRVFLDGAYNDDGAQLSYILPTDMFAEVGGGVFRGGDHPFGHSSGDVGAWLAYARIGDDIGEDQSWRLGVYSLTGDSRERLSNDDDVEFNGSNSLYAADIRYTWAPTGNAKEQELTLQGEYFRRNEKGTYEDHAIGTGAVDFKDTSGGWYAQAVYKFMPEWRLGLRYSELSAADVPAGLAGSLLDGDGHDPRTYSAMVDWTNSEFSRVRAQYNHEEMARGETDHQFMLQYIMSIGAHGAHAY